MAHRTPGQAAYEKFRELMVRRLAWGLTEWSALGSDDTAIWEAVAEAASDQEFDNTLARARSKGVRRCP